MASTSTGTVPTLAMGRFVCAESDIVRGTPEGPPGSHASDRKGE
jgi:hypothetical protein